MGRRALEVHRRTVLRIRDTLLSEAEKASLRSSAWYEGAAYHKRSPGDFNLSPPSDPRPDKTLCDVAGVMRLAEAQALLSCAIEGGLVSEAVTADGVPKQRWAIDDRGWVFEAIHGGSRPGAYHGYPILSVDPLSEVVTSALRGQP